MITNINFTYSAIKKFSPNEQKAYDYAMQNSHKKGPCCCKCWRWYIHGGSGIGKYLIKNHGFTGDNVGYSSNPSWS